MNLSEGGLATQLEQKSSVGMPVRFRFKLPDTDTWIEGKGKIAWVAKGLSGVKFAAIAAKLRKEMNAWLQKKMNGPGLLTPVLTNATTKRYY